MCVFRPQPAEAGARREQPSAPGGCELLALRAAVSRVISLCRPAPPHFRSQIPSPARTPSRRPRIASKPRSARTTADPPPLHVYIPRRPLPVSHPPLAALRLLKMGPIIFAGFENNIIFVFCYAAKMFASRSDSGGVRVVISASEACTRRFFCVRRTAGRTDRLGIF